MFGHFALVVAQLTSPLFDAYDRITPEVAAERVARCGAGAVTVRSENEIDVDVVVVAARDAITDVEIAGIAKAASFYDVELPYDAQPRLNAITTARAAAITKAERAKWLAAHKLLAQLPTYKVGVTNDDQFARKIEALCRAKGALNFRYGVHAINPEWVGKNVSIFIDDGPFACVINAAMASGFEFGFIGNEQSPP